MLDERVRHRLRAIQLKHWQRPKTMCRELRVSGTSDTVAGRLMGNRRGWRRNSVRLRNTKLTIACSDRLAVPRRP